MELIDENYISSPVNNFCTDEEIDNNTKIEILFNCKTKQFSYSIVFEEKTPSSNTDGKTLLSSEGITKNGKIIDKKTCNDLY